MVDRVAFTIGSFPVYWYGILIMLGVFLGAWVASIEARRRGMDPVHVWNGLTVAIILGLIGARIYHVLTPPPSMGDPLYYWHNPLEVFNIRQGGLGIYGAIVGGILGVVLYARYAKVHPFDWIDMGAPGLALGQAIGRWGNFFNQELYGQPTDLPWGITIEPQYRLSGYEQFERFHPAFLYESLWNLFTFLVLLFLMRRRREELMRGELVGLYVILYSTGRILLEFVRLDSATLWGIPIAQLVAGSIILVTGGLLLLRRLRVRPTGEDAEVEVQE